MPTGFSNLGDAIDRSGDPDALAVIDLVGNRRRVSPTTARSTRSPTQRRAGFSRGASAGANASRSYRPTAASSSPPSSASCAALVAVPINWKLPAPTVEFILRDCTASLVLCDRARLPLCPADLPRFVFEEDFAALLDHGPLLRLRRRRQTRRCFSTPRARAAGPKGVVLSHSSHFWVIDMRLRGDSLTRTPGARRGAALPHECARRVAGGAGAARHGYSAAGLYGTELYRAAAMYRATALTSLPTMIAMVSRETTLLKYTDLSSVSAIRMGSAPVSEGLVEAARRAFPHAVIINGYGTTEAGPIVFSAHPDGRPTPDLSVGVAHPHVELRLVTGDDGETDEGVLQMRCPALMTGYHNLPEETAKALTSDGFYTTGDVFRQDRDGFYYFVRRGDDMFVSGGESVCPGEIEAMLERHPEIHQAVVVPVDDELKFKKPVAFVVARPGAAPSEAAVKAFALANAAPYLHPRRVWFLPEMPLAGTNKIDRRSLARRAAELLSQA